jgi:hypothetical protein
MDALNKKSRQQTGVPSRVDKQISSKHTMNRNATKSITYE